MKNIKEINIKNRTYYFFNDMISIKDFDSGLIKIHNNSYKNIDIYNINGVNPSYLIICKADGYLEENNGNKNLGFTSTVGNKKY